MKQENCNCYEAIDQMINEGGCFGSLLYREKERLLREFGTTITEIDTEKRNKEGFTNGITS